MNRTDLVRAVSNKDNLPVAVVEQVVDSLVEVMRMSLAVGEEISMRGFGRFERKTLKETMRRTPATGELIRVPERTSIRFTPAVGFRQYVHERSNGSNGSS